MLETIFRSGVPPHIGQSPVPGSAAVAVGSKLLEEGKRQKAVVSATDINAPKKIGSALRLTGLVLTILFMAISPVFYECGLVIFIDLKIVKIEFRQRATKNARCALTVGYWIDALDHPC